MEHGVLRCCPSAWRGLWVAAPVTRKGNGMESEAERACRVITRYTCVLSYVGWFYVGLANALFNAAHLIIFIYNGVSSLILLLYCGCFAQKLVSCLKSSMQAAKEYVASLMMTRDEEEKRREGRSRRRIDFIVAEAKERSIRANEERSRILWRGANATSRVECDFRRSLGEMGHWWDLISKHVLEEKRSCEEAEKMQSYMNNSYLGSVMRREIVEQASVVTKDERRYMRMEEAFLAEERAKKDEAVKGVMETVLSGAFGCIDLLEASALGKRTSESLLTETVVNCFIRTINKTPLTVQDRAHAMFELIFRRHPFRITADVFLELLNNLYKRVRPRDAPINRFDVCRVPLFLLDGPKYSGKSVVSHQLARQLSLVHISDHDLVNRAMEAYRKERNGPAGKVIEETLLRGEPVNTSTIVELMHLQMKKPPDGCKGILFDGTVAGVAELQRLQLIVPRSPHPFEGALSDWTPRAVLNSAKYGHFEGIDEASSLLTVCREPRHERVMSKCEGKVRMPKKGVDLSTLPPPVLPEVEVLELTPEEEEAIEIWGKREESFNALFSAMVYIHCGTAEIFNRFAGLRVDKETGEQYHMVFHPPPPERVPHVANIDRTKASTTLLHSIVYGQRKRWDDLRRWALRERADGMELHEVNGEQDIDGIARDVRCILSAIQETFAVNIQRYDATVAAKKRKEFIEKSIAEQEKHREAERIRLVKIYTDSGVPVPPELECNVPPPPFYSMPEDVPELFFNALTKFRSWYENQYSWAGSAVDDLLSLLLNYRSLALETYQQFWSMPDGKQEKLQRFITNYNNLPVFVLGQVSCKEELHLLVDQLREELFRIVEMTAKEAVAKVDQITKKEVFMNPWGISMCNVGIAIVQGELERFLSTLNMTLIYFSTVVNEPCFFEEFDSEVIVMRSVNEAMHDQQRGKEKKLQGAKKFARIDELAERTVEDVFLEAVGKLLHTATNYIEKFQHSMVTAARIRDSTKSFSAGLDDGRYSLILTKCLPFALGELAKVQERITSVKQYFATLIREAEAYCTNLKEAMLSQARERHLYSAGAVNTAIYVIRNSIEMERPIPSMQMGRETFAIFSVKEDVRRADCEAVGLFSSVTSGPEGLPRFHATLTVQRLVWLINTFRRTAPDYAVRSTEFLRIVRSDDYAGAATGGTRLKTPAEVFAAFDPQNCGLIDWREFVLHLLLWCAAVPEKLKVETGDNFYLGECSIAELLETRAALGLTAVNKETFQTAPFFFTERVSKERLASYIDALWMTFSGEDGMLDPVPLLAMMCADRQPVRGVQKVFHTLSPSMDGALTPSSMDRAFHVHATNPCRMCLPDVFSAENLEILYGGENALRFDSVCELVMGRYMLNSTQAFLRKSFVVDV
uniref:EF-hand domain-containing protein n=1 Tax=Trypanosoma vivax (strain Y486) TaxID=1055687 RepID=G0U784_TRYVY|nr:conserved hypothetical protein, fragment [Trypanosoma vivax Y486]